MALQVVSTKIDPDLIPLARKRAGLADDVPPSAVLRLAVALLAGTALTDDQRADLLDSTKGWAAVSRRSKRGAADGTRAA